MADFSVGLTNGVDRSNDETRLAPGFARSITNAIYLPDNGDRLFKIPGRTNALTLGSPQTTTPYGLAFLQFDTQASQHLLLANGQFYRQAASQALGAWTSVNDQQGSPVAFPRTGTFLKALPDNLGRWIVWTGALERPLLIHEDGFARFLGLKHPNDRPTITALTTAITATRANAGADSVGSATLEGSSVTFSGSFANKSNAFDGNVNTQSTTTRASAGGTGVVFSFPAGTTNSTALFVSISTTSLAPTTSDPRDPISGLPRESSLSAKMYVQVSTDSGTNYTTVYTAAVPLRVTNVQFNLSDGIAQANLRARVILRYISGTTSVTGNVIEVYLASQTAGASSPLADGTYYYATTEIHQYQIGSFTFTVESAPTEPITLGTLTDNATAVTPVYGYKLTFAAKTNDESMGIAAAQHYIGVYRSTKSGVWPDLGRISVIPITQTTFTDNFTAPLPDAVTLGSPGLNIGYAGILAAPIAGEPPAIYDATCTQSGLIVAIPQDNRTHIKWNMPGLGDYWPYPHDIIPLDSPRYDKLMGVTSIGDAIILFLRSRVMRLIHLPVMNRPNFDIAQIARDVLSPNEGLAGTPLAYCSFTTQDGRAAVTWVSDNGLWWTDGTLVSERGQGVQKFSVNMDWDNDVDKTKLDQTKLTYDPTFQVIYFDYIDKTGTPQTYILHVHPEHWIPSGEDMVVPKIVGPTPQPTGGFIQRALGEQSGGGFFLWSLTPTKIYNERTGTLNDGAPITTTITSGWLYPAGPMSEFDIFYAGMYHNDWGTNETCTLTVTGRRDQTQVEHAVSRTISLSGARVTRAFQHVSGQSARVTISHTGSTVSAGAFLAFGPVVFDLESMGEIEKD
jgi:hypothetical protein